MKNIKEKYLRIIILSIFISYLSFTGNANTYYVSNYGNDSNSGLSVNSAWKTISKVRSFAFIAGDKILFKRGEIFGDAQFSLKNGGVVGNRITISSYGSGEKPIIDGLDEITGWQTPENWSVVSTNVWKMAKSLTTYRMWINGKDRMKAETTSLNASHPWTYSAGYLYVLAPSNPSGYYKSLVDGTNHNRLGDLSLNNLNILNLTFRGGSSAALRLLNCNNITIDSCEIGYRSFAGLVISTTTASSSDNFVISNCILSSGDSLMYDYFKDPHTTTEAILLSNGVTNCKIFNNYMYGWSHGGVFLKNITTNYPCHDIEIYNNYVTAPLIDYARGFGCDYATNGYNVSIHDNSIVNTSVCTQINGNGLKFYNNIIDNVRDTPYKYTGSPVNSGIDISAYETFATNMEVYNNTILNCQDDGINMNDYGNGNSYNNIHDNNIWNCDSYPIYCYAKPGMSNNKYIKNHLYSSSKSVVVYCSPNSLTADSYNSMISTVGDITSGNDSKITFTISGKVNVITNVNDVKITHNGTKSAKVISISQLMIDLLGNKYSGSATVKPFTSLVLIPDLNITKYYTEYKSICQGSNYNGWTLSGKYLRTLVSKSGADSIVTTNLTVNPSYTVREDITINEGESYNGWTKSGQYIRKLNSSSGCDSAVTTNLTVEIITIKQGELLPTHFSTVWQGENGVNHMNIMVVSAILEDLPLKVNDEIAIYNGVKCVGAVKLGKAINSVDNSTFVNISTSQDDGSGNGYVTGDTILFKIWDDKNQTEYVAKAITYRKDISTWQINGKFSPGATSVAEILSYEEITQNIQLVKGYNMISTYVAASNPNVCDITKSLNELGNLVKIQDESGNSYEDWGSYGGWINKLGSFQKTEGYKIKVANDCTLKITGRPVALPLDIPLKAGWNIISFPRNELQDAISIFLNLMNQNKLIKVQDETGNSIENWGIYGGWKNNIGNFTPGKAYRVKMNGDAILTFNQNILKSSILSVKNEKPEYFSSVSQGNGNDHMNINIVNIQESGLNIGDELAAFDGNFCVGAVKISEFDFTDGSVSIAASSVSDENSADGFTEGHVIKIIAWNKINGDEMQFNTEIISGQLIYTKSSSVMVKAKSLTTNVINFANEFKIDLFPNPCHGKVTVRFSEVPESGSRIDIVDITGRTVASRLISGLSEDFQLDNQPSGVYLVKSIIGSNEIIKKLIVN